MSHNLYNLPMHEDCPVGMDVKCLFSLLFLRIISMDSDKANFCLEQKN